MDKQDALLDSADAEEAVSQLNKCALEVRELEDQIRGNQVGHSHCQMANEERSFLNVAEGKIIVRVVSFASKLVRLGRYSE